MAKELELKFDLTLSKYISVWIWSILFGANSGVIYTLTSYHSFMKDRFGQIVIGSIIVMSILFSMITYWQLFSYLSRYLIPRFFENSIEKKDKKLHGLAAKKLKNVVVFVMLTLFLRLLILLFEVIIPALGSQPTY